MRPNLSDPSSNVRTMAIPDLVPIVHEPGYHTATIGSYDGGQFFGSVTATLADGSADEDDWAPFKRWYAVLHRFDSQGTHTGSDIWFAGTDETYQASTRKAQARLDDWLDALPSRVYGDIAIRLFQVEFEGQVFGLVDESAEYDGADHAELLPDCLGFDPPWDGVYDT